MTRDTDTFVFKSQTTATRNADHDHKNWIDLLSMGGGVSGAGDHDSWIDVLSVSEPIHRTADSSDTIPLQDATVSDIRMESLNTQATIDASDFIMW